MSPLITLFKRVLRERPLRYWMVSLGGTVVLFWLVLEMIGLYAPATPWRLLCGALLLMFVSILLWKMFGSTLERQVRIRTRELADAKFKAEQASIRKSEHLANLSHEIRTPLNGLVGSLTLLERSHLPAPQLELLRVARQSSGLLLDIINDMLDFSRIESGLLVLTYNRVELLQVFDQALLTVTLRAQERNLKMTAFIAANVPKDAVVDGLRIRQILVNLLGNAVKFTERGEIHLRAEMENDRLMVTVSDTGRGIGKELQGLIFQPFVQGSAYDNGTGLGLAIAWRLTQMMGGELSLQSEVGAGASFTVCVPLHDASAPLPLFSGCLPAPAALHTQLREWGVGTVEGSSVEWDAPELAHLPARLWQQVSSTLQANESTATERVVCSTVVCPWSLKILIVDDVATNRQVLEQMLSGMGHVVEVASSGAQALKAGRSQVFDLVLMDIRMPEVDGYTVTRIWQAPGGDVLDPDTPIVALTANVAQHEYQRAKDAGMSGYLTKPVCINELSVTLSEVAVMQLARGIDMSPNQSLDGPIVDVSGERSRLAAVAELMCLHDQLVVAWSTLEQGAMLDALHALKGCSDLVGMTLVSQVVGCLESQVLRGEVIGDENLCDLRRLIAAGD